MSHCNKIFLYYFLASCFIVLTISCTGNTNLINKTELTTDFACGLSFDSAGTVPTIVPPALTQVCAGCHGPTGTGNATYPSLTQTTNFTDFVNIVRQGKTQGNQVMPSFDNTWVTDDDLKMIYAYVNQHPVKASSYCPAPTVMSATEIETTYTAGLKIWRTPGEVDGLACYNCHGPDPLELAYVGFSDGDILRRASKHINTDQAKQIVTMVHAIRDKYQLPKRNPLTFRPMQPGDEVLPGNSAAARDLAFAQELQSMGLIFMNKPINSVQDAHAAEQELLNLNLHTLKIGIPFNLWSEDGFHNPPGYQHNCAADIDMCDDHGTIADWVPSAPHTISDPNNLSKLITMQDTYLANPNQANFSALINATEQSQQPLDVNDPGQNSSDALYFLDNNKYIAVQIGQHCMRLKAMGLPGCDQMGIFPFPNEGHDWSIGGTANLFGSGYSEMSTQCDIDYQQSNTCGNPPLYQTSSVLANLTPGTPLHEHFQRLRHTWFMMHFLNFDPTLMMTGGDDTVQQDEYFARSVFLANNDTGAFGNPPTNPTYSIHNVFQILLRNVEMLNHPEVFTNLVFPFYHPDLGFFKTTIPNMQSGYFPELTNFTEGKDLEYSNYWQLFTPQDEPRRSLYQLMAGNMYRLFFYKLIGDLQTNGNSICQPYILQMRIQRAQLFLSQPEIVAQNGTADAKMFETLNNLVSNTQIACAPPPASLTLPIPPGNTSPVLPWPYMPPQPYLPTTQSSN